jgi:hypothetical protein
MRDCAGVPIKEGNLVQVKVGLEWLVGVVHKVEEGGLLVPINPTQKALTPEKLFLLFEVNLADAPPGQNHPVIRRLCHPEREVIVPIATTKGSH